MSFGFNNDPWSKGEKAVARRAYDQAYDRELAALADEVRRKAQRITEPRHVWALHDFLTRKRKEIDQKYNYRYSQLIFVFSRLIRDGWLTVDELAGLAEEKLARIRAWLEL
jgi:Photoprotection regulator fluorescence recovery protein